MYRRQAYPPRSSGLPSLSRPPLKGRRPRKLVCRLRSARPSDSSVGPALQLRERRGHESLALHGVHEIDGPRAAESGEGIIEPAGHPGGGIESFGIARLLDHRLQLPHELGDADDALAFTGRQGLALLRLFVDSGGGEAQGFEGRALSDGEFRDDAFRLDSADAALDHTDALER